MKKPTTKKVVGNLFWMVLLMVFLFTPAGFHAKVFFARVFSFSPSELAMDEQRQLSDDTWKLANVKGEIVDFNTFEGQVVLVSFWATWCPPCIAEIPSFEKLYKDYSDKVAFVFVANDEPLKVARFVTKNEISLPIYFEGSRPPAQLVSKSIPATYVIDKTGKIVVAKTGVADWNGESTRALLDRLLEN